MHKTSDDELISSSLFHFGRLSRIHVSRSLTSALHVYICYYEFLQNYFIFIITLTPVSRLTGSHLLSYSSDRQIPEFSKDTGVPNSSQESSPNGASSVGSIQVGLYERFFAEDTLTLCTLRYHGES